MRWKSHLAIGVFLGALMSYFLSLDATWFALFSLASGAFALLPDLDLRKSKASQILFALFLLFAAAAAIFVGGSAGGALAVFACLLLAFAAMDILFRPRHRTILHSGWAALALASVVFVFFGWKLALAVFVGYASHLAADRIG